MKHCSESLLPPDITHTHEINTERRPQAPCQGAKPSRFLLKDLMPQINSTAASIKCVGFFCFVLFGLVVTICHAAGASVLGRTPKLPGFIQKRTLGSRMVTGLMRVCQMTGKTSPRQESP